MLLAGGCGAVFIFEFAVVVYLLSGGGGAGAGAPGVDELFCAPVGGGFV